MLSWNKLPSDVKNSQSLNIFKSNLESFKNKSRALGISGRGNYWEIRCDDAGIIFYYLFIYLFKQPLSPI